MSTTFIGRSRPLEEVWRLTPRSALAVYRHTEDILLVRSRPLEEVWRLTPRSALAVYRHTEDILLVIWGRKRDWRKEQE